MPTDETLPTAANRVLIAVNPKAGTSSAAGRVARLERLLRERGSCVQVLADLAAVAEQANRGQAEGWLRALVGVGGDGTAAELVNRTDPGVPITLLPAGNENLLARYLQLDPAPESLAETIAAGRLLRLDAGRAGNRVFLLMLGCGFDAEVVGRVHARRTGHISLRNYIAQTLSAMRTYRYPEVLVHWEGGAEGGQPCGGSFAARWAFVFNLPCYGGGLRIDPHADGRDGQLDVCTFGGGGLYNGLRYALAVLCRRHHRLADFRRLQAVRLRITAAEPVPYQLDGDPGGTLPVEVEVLPRRLALVVPECRAAELVQH
jgi:diacylglycerol kinase family enzyme